MASNQEKRDALLRFLDRRVFDPILDAPESNYALEDRPTLARIKSKTESEKRRFHHGGFTAGELKAIYLSDLIFEEKGQINLESEYLHLPRLTQVKEDFLKLCRRLDV